MRIPEPPCETPYNLLFLLFRSAMTRFGRHAPEIRIHSFGSGRSLWLRCRIEFGSREHVFRIESLRSGKAKIGGCMGFRMAVLVFAFATTAQAQVTFTKDVAPILQRSCQVCHRPGAIAPMSLLTYEDARPWARAIREKVVKREMPPWYIDKNIGITEFKDDPSLSDADIATISKWVDAGAPMGKIGRAHV